jgi:large subunit ribosomal protein L32
MAVQKSRKTKSTRGMRRSHDKLVASTTTIDQETGELHLRHHITPKGYYKGKQIISKKSKINKTEDSIENNE